MSRTRTPAFRSSLRFLFAPLAAIAVLAIVACGGGDDPNDAPFFPTGPGGGATLPAGGERPSPTPQPQPSVTPPACTGPSIANIARDNRRSFDAPPTMVIDPTKTYVATMQTTRGVVTMELSKDSPITTNNFVFLSCHGFYDGLTFHRVVKTPTPFVVQGGDPEGTGAGGPGYKFQTEVNPVIKHDAAGVVSMANSGPNTNGSQFFITLAPAPHLDNGSVGVFNAFGRVTSGMEAVNAIRQGDTILAISITES